MPKAIAGQYANISHERKLGIILENGYNIFVVRLKKSAPFGKSIFGFQIFDIVEAGSPNSHEVGFRVVRKNTNELEFTPDESKVPMAYVVDTEKNRRLLAKTFYDRHYEVVLLMTPDGNMPGIQIRNELKKLADEFGIKPPTASGSSFDMLVKSQHHEKRYTREEATLIIEKKYETWIQYLQERDGSDWRKSDEYAKKIRPEIDALVGLKPLGASDEPKSSVAANLPAPSQKVAEDKKEAAPGRKKPGPKPKVTQPEPSSESLVS